MGAVSGAIGFGTAELVGKYFPAIKKLEDRIIQRLGLDAKNLKERSLTRSFWKEVEKRQIGSYEDLQIIRGWYNETVSKFSLNLKFMLSVDVGQEAFRAPPAHVRVVNGLPQIQIHFDNINWVVNPAFHALEWAYQGFVYKNW